MEKLPPAKKWIKTILIYAEFGHQHGKKKKNECFEKWVRALYKINTYH